MIKSDNRYWDIVDIQKSIDETFEVNCRPDISSEDENFSDVEVTGTLRNIAGAVLADLTVRGNYKSLCDRCLDDVVLPLTAKIKTSVTEDMHSTDDSLFIGNGKIDFGMTAYEALSLEIPTQILCKEDCKGLCHICGTNLNIKQCDCLKREVFGE